jgi:hypothetical protein
MDVPWFLQQLGLPPGSDERAIKRAYAQRLKKIDTSTDIEGFTRLREAYEAALQSLNGDATQDAPKHDGAPAHAPILTPSQATSGTPPSEAWQALATMQQAIADGTSAGTALAEALGPLRQGHLQWPAAFELLLIDSLAQGTMPAPRAVFNAARDTFEWMDMTHLVQLGPRGRWLHGVMLEERVWSQDVARWQGAGWFERLTRGDDDLPDADMAAQWPRVLRLLQQYPNLLPLMVGRPALEQWQQAFAALPALQRDLAEGHAGAAMPMSPAEFRRTRPPRGRSRAMSLNAALVIAFLAARPLAELMMGGHSSPATPVPALLTESTPAPSPSQRALLAATPPVADALRCRQVESLVHASDWVAPRTPSQTQRLAQFIRQCVQTHRWPHWRMADPRLAQLGVML